LKNPNLYRDLCPLEGPATPEIAPIRPGFSLLYSILTSWKRPKIFRTKSEASSWLNREA